VEQLLALPDADADGADEIAMYVMYSLPYDRALYLYTITLWRYTTIAMYVRVGVFALR
jgi:hypothetical protein